MISSCHRPGQTSILLALALVLVACEGPEGPAGAAGAPGADGQDGAPGADGVDGEDGVDGQDGQDGQDGEDGEDGQDGHDAGWIELDADGLVGFVRDQSGQPVSSGTIYLVPADEVAALPATTVAVDSTDDEPLEDVIAAIGSTMQMATVAADGSYAFDTVADGSYFLTYVPLDGDGTWLPGGSMCRTAVDAGTLVGTQQDVDVSYAAPEGAFYVGSGACVSCHGKTDIRHTLHRNGIWSPDEYGPLQGLDVREELWDAFDGKFEVGTTVYYYDYDSSRGMDKYKTSETDPGANVSFSATVQEGDDGYEVVLRNVANPSDPDRTFRVDLVYGGGVYKQRYMTRVEGSYGAYHVMLPTQYQSTGTEDSTYPRTAKTWRDYNGSYWYDETNDLLTQPGVNKSFEKNCVSCHAVGARVTGSDSTNWTADLVTDRIWGDFDFDGDGYAEEVNTGCENCHGPGSAHWESTGQGKYIVSPELLTPEREAMICGQCHSRPKGALSTDSPVNSDGWMMVAGTSRNDFLAQYATVQLDGSSSDYYGDDLLHSKSHHQQYSDFIRGGMYKNGSHLMTCSSCHDPHKYENKNQLRADPTDNEAACGGACHSAEAADLSAHIDTQLGTGMGSLMDSAQCVECHMAKTAKTGAGEPGLVIDGVQYWQNDISNHIFDVPEKAWSDTTGQSMPTPYTDTCANSACHGSVE